MDFQNTRSEYHGGSPNAEACVVQRLRKSSLLERDIDDLKIGLCLVFVNTIHCQRFPSLAIIFCFCRILYTLTIESYYSCMRGMISRERNSAVKEKQRVGKHC